MWCQTLATTPSLESERYFGRVGAGGEEKVAGKPRVSQGFADERVPPDARFASSGDGGGEVVQPTRGNVSSISRTKSSELKT
jgi:hypothetical protein